MQVAIAVLIFLVQSANAGELKVTTESSDTDKQCADYDDEPKTKTGETELTMRLKITALEAAFDLATGVMVIDLPSRYHDYWAGGELIASASDTSMVDSDLLSVRLTADDGVTVTNYYPSLKVEEG